jgi:hypothetical protein
MQCVYCIDQIVRSIRFEYIPKSACVEDLTDRRFGLNGNEDDVREGGESAEVM